MIREPDMFFKDEETTKKYILFLQDVLKNRSKTSTNLIEQIKIQKELLLLDINVTTILKMDINEAVNYIMNMINAKKIKKEAEYIEVDAKINSLIENETNADVSEFDKTLMTNLNCSVSDSIQSTIDDIEALDLENTRTEIFKNTPTTIEEVLKVDSDKYDEERSIIRESLFNKKITIHIMKTGKNYQYKWNVSMSDLVIKIPTTWEIDIDQSLLLELYAKVFNTLGRENKTELLNKLTKTLTVFNCDNTLSDNSNILERSENSDFDGDDDIDSDMDTDGGSDETGDEFSSTEKKKRNKRVNIKGIKNFTDVEIIQLFKDRQNVSAVIDSYTSVRSLIKRALNITYSEATEKIITALSRLVDDAELESFGITNTSHLYRNISKMRPNNA